MGSRTQPLCRYCRCQKGGALIIPTDADVVDERHVDVLVGGMSELDRSSFVLNRALTTNGYPLEVSYNLFLPSQCQFRSVLIVGNRPFATSS